MIDRRKQCSYQKTRPAFQPPFGFGNWPKSCRWCMGLFMPKKEGVRYCCKVCGGADRRNRKRKGIVPDSTIRLYCRQCGYFKESLPADRLCGDKCRQEFDKEKREAKNELARDKWANDPEYREKWNAYERKRKTSDPDYRKKMNAYGRKRYANDPEYRKKVAAKNRTRRQERYANDPEYRQRLLTKNRRKRNSRKLLVKLITRQMAKCYICSQRLPTESNLIHVDHVIPLSSGGTSDPSNLRAACSTCNLRKGARLPGPLPLFDDA